MKSFIFTCFLLLAAGFAVMWLGLIPINADTKPSKIEEWVAQTALQARLKKETADLKNPFEPKVGVLMEGLKAYQNNCSGCHGSPKEKENLFAAALYPPAPQFTKEDLGDLSVSDIFYIAKHGIRFSGMPGFKTMMSDDDMWKVSNFLHELKKLPYEVKTAWEK